MLGHPVKVNARGAKKCKTSRLHNCIYAINGQTNGWNYTNFERNLAMMVIYLPVMFEFDWTKRFWVRVQKRKCWWTDKRTPNTRNYTNFERNLAMTVIYHPVKFEFVWTKRLWVRVQKRKCWRTNEKKKPGQTNRRNYNNFERSLAMMVIYLPVKFEFD